MKCPKRYISLMALRLYDPQTYQWTLWGNERLWHPASAASRTFRCQRRRRLGAAVTRAHHVLRNDGHCHGVVPQAGERATPLAVGRVLDRVGGTMESVVTINDVGISLRVHRDRPRARADTVPNANCSLRIYAVGRNDRDREVAIRAVERAGVCDIEVGCSASGFSVSIPPTAAPGNNGLAAACAAPTRRVPPIPVPYAPAGAKRFRTSLAPRSSVTA